MPTHPGHPLFEFHVSRDARDRCQFPDALFATDGRVVFASPAAARRFAARLTQARGGTPVASPAELFAMGLLDEVMHVVLARYREQQDPRAWLDALAWYESRLGAETQDRALLAFVDQYPPVEVYRGRRSSAGWLGEVTGGTTHRAVALEEMLLLWIANGNPACREYAELFDDTPLRVASAYGSIVESLKDYFDTRPRFGPGEANLVEFLLAPLRAAPHSLLAQLDWIRQQWGWLLGDLLERLLDATDALAEEGRALWMWHHPFGGGAFGGDSSAAAVPHYGGHGVERDVEYEAFSPDEVWMPEVVMIAKSTYVWLDQLARTYGRDVRTLDQIPDEELDRLAAFGITCLWLIGLWERSPASAAIKHRTGNPDAMASAYSLFDYVIAGELGGEAAWSNLRDRAARRGIRLASDMVPNHMGLDSRWVVEHPEWFLQLDHSPYPAYRFDGPDLSSDGRVEIKIEDHYWDRSDAAVVFRRVDRANGDTRYIYHGNDGTSFPWNDTAQLDYLRADVREQVIRTILDVARRFPIIRFDAAMTLAKRHIQRLWFPEPGSGGGIPSRAGHGITRAQFDAALPVEFWREVVDRVAHEAPGTLLLAEAFWMMEGYFVRTLGMHRVYNSAFMNMLRDEQNANYRSVLKNTLEFDPDILQRYVNFVNNPDERTAVEQFGRGEKYFGVAVMMATLPGLPMFGHGQFEGFEEKYGMEYRQARLAELVDTGLEAEHRRRIAPLLHRRPLFTSSREFLLYDAWLDSGAVNEDVYAYSNRAGAASALVVFHNRWAETDVWLRTSVAYADKSQGRALRSRTLHEGLRLPDGDRLVRCRERVSEHEHLFQTTQLRSRGLPLHLAGYESRAYLDWREQPEDGRPWRRLAERLDGRGVRDLDEALRQLELEPVHEAFATLLAEAMDAPQGRDSLAHATGRLLAAAHAAVPGPWPGDPSAVVAQLARRFEALDRLGALEARGRRRWPLSVGAVLPVGSRPSHLAHAAGRAWAALEALALARDPSAPHAAAVALFDALLLRQAIAKPLHARGCDAEQGWMHAARVRAAFAHRRREDERPDPTTGRAPRQAWIDDPEIRWLLGVHEHQGVTWFQQEGFEHLHWFQALLELLSLSTDFDAAAWRSLRSRLDRGAKQAEASGWKWEAYVGSAKPARPTRKTAGATRRPAARRPASGTATKRTPRKPARGR